MATLMQPAVKASPDTPAVPAAWETALSSLQRWLLPAWAVLCGAIASNGLAWHDGAGWLRLALALLLVELGWAGLWQALGTTDWAAPFAAWHSWRAGSGAPALPYSRPGAPGHSGARWLADFGAWWRDCLWPARHAAVSAALVALAATVVLTAVLGWSFVLLTLAALAAMQLGLAWGQGRGTASPGWSALVYVLVPWLAGHVAIALLSVRSLFAAGGLGLLCAAIWSLQRVYARWLVACAHLALALLLLALGHPLAGVAVLVLLAPQLALVPWLDAHGEGLWHLRFSLAWVLAAGLITVWAF